MQCGCSLCLVRAGGPAPELDGCSCPGQVHVDVMCFVTRTNGKSKIQILREAALDVISRIEANDVDFSKFGGQEEVNLLKKLCTTP